MIDGIEKVYLSGPMSGHLDYNFPVFNAMAKRLRDAGYVVLNPAETAGGADHLDRAWYFRFDFAVISCVDAVFVMQGWRDSSGAKAEVIYAHELGLPIWELDATNGDVRLHRLLVSHVEVDAQRGGFTLDGQPLVDEDER